MKKGLSQQLGAGLGVILSLFLFGPIVSAAEFCGLWSEVNNDTNDVPRFRLLKEFDGRAFLDMETCLIWHLDVSLEGQTLEDATYSCANRGQGGPSGGHMGWKLPTLAELTSLESEQWLKQEQTFKSYGLPPLARTEKPLWTTTSWPSEPATWAAVTFSARTTIAHSIKPEEKAGVWCVRGAPAKGLR